MDQMAVCRLAHRAEALFTHLTADLKHIQEIQVPPLCDKPEEPGEADSRAR